jgi:hypothetical protein
MLFTLLDACFSVRVHVQGSVLCSIFAIPDWEPNLKLNPN